MTTPIHPAQPGPTNATAPWDLSLTPNYARAMAIDTVHADQISEADFYLHYVAQNRPCHLVGAIAHWPAFKQWHDIAYLKQATGNAVVSVRSEPMWEFGPTKGFDQAAIDRRNASILEEMPLHDFLDRAAAHPEQLVLHSMPVGPGSPLQGLLKDIGKFQFLPRPGKSRAYVPFRAFCYRNSYTDWHFHPADEALMTQVVGDKEVLLLPPDQQSWEALDPVRQVEGNLYGIDLTRFPKAGELRPFRAVVRAGDALYIPVYWWHAVQSADDRFGITVAATFSSPLHVAGDLRYPVARNLVAQLLRSRMMPLGLVAVGYSYLHRLGAVLTGRGRKRPAPAPAARSGGSPGSPGSPVDTANSTLKDSSMARTSLWVRYPFWCRFTALLVFPVLVLVILAVTALWKSLPHTGGQLDVAGLRAPVSVQRDLNSIPDIRASNDQDAYFALGFVHAQDRLWQMEMYRRTGAGRLSEVLGNSSLSSDITMRRLGLYDNALKILRGLDGPSRAVLLAYVDGVNAGAKALPVLPLQFHMVGMQAEPWKAEDSLVMMQMMAWQFSSNLGAEIQRLLLIQNYGIATANTLMPGVPTELAAAMAGLDAGEVKKYTGIGQDINLFGDPRKTIGSNGWAVSGKHTASGLPMLANDPHLSTPIPSLWYLASIKGDKLDVSGATMPGLPFVLIGRNPDIAWGLTNAMVDTQDVVIEDINPMNRDQYKVGGVYVDMQIKREEIRVKQDFLRAPTAPQVITVRRTVHGPLVSDISDPLGRISFSVRWTGDDDQGGTFASFVKMNHARSWTEFNDALSGFVAPIHNFVYADRAGNIGYVAPGKYPLRAVGNGSVPTLGSRAGDIWSGALSDADVPRAFNPPEGYVVTANNNFLAKDYQHHLTSDWAPAYRAERIGAELERMLNSGTGKLSARDMMRLQADVVTPSLHNGVLAAMRQVAAQTPAQSRALAVLGSWDGVMSKESGAATLYTAWLSHLNILLLDQIKNQAARSASGFDPLAGMKLRENDEFLEKVLTGSEGALCSAKGEGCGPLLRQSLDRALAELASLGDDAEDWKWGKVHRITFAHFPFSKARFAPGMPAAEESSLSTIFDRDIPSAGGSNTVNVGTPSMEKETKYLQFEAAMYRQVVDFGTPDGSIFMQGTGQSGNPFSSHYDDLIVPHQLGHYVPMSRRVAVTTLRLQPLTIQQK